VALDWDDLKFFLAVAQAKSVAAAAKSLKVNHSTVIRRLDNMEARLDLTLFVRGKSGYGLTEAGNSVFISATRMSEVAQELERQLTDSDNQSLAGNVVVSAADFVISKLLAPSVPLFSAQAPNITLSFVATNDFLSLSGRGADIVVRLTDNHKLHLPENLYGRKLGDIHMCAYKGAHSRSKNLRWIPWDNSVNFEKWISNNSYPSFPKDGFMNSPFLQMHALKESSQAAILPCFLADGEPGIERIRGCKVFNGFEAWLLTHGDLKKIKRINATMQHVGRFVEDQLKKKSVAYKGY